MSAKNFVSYGDAETLFSEYAGCINDNTRNLESNSITKNVLPVTLDLIKKLNGNYSWSDESGEDVATSGDLSITVSVNMLDNSISSITLNGNSGNFDKTFKLVDKVTFDKDAKIWRDNTIIVSGCGTGGVNSYYIEVGYGLSSTVKQYGGNPVEVNVSASTSTEIRYCDIIIKRNQTFNNVTFYPMFCLKSHPSSNYVPFIPSINNKIKNITKYYLHEVEFRALTPSEMREADDYSFRNGDYSRYVIGIKRSGINSQWVDCFNDDEGAFNWEDDYDEQQLSNKNKILLRFISPSRYAVDMFGLKTLVADGICIPIDSYPWGNSCTKVNDFFFLGNYLTIHFTGNQATYDKRGLERYTDMYVPEMLLHFSYNTVEDWTDTVTEWTA